MRKHAFFLLSATLLIPCAARPQVQAPAARPPQQPIHLEDGGMSERLESIVIPPKPQAPFTCTLQTEWVRTLADGGTITLVNERRIARDGNGRVYQERWWLVPKNGKQKSQMEFIQITDPQKHTLYSCGALSNNHVCEITPYMATASMPYTFSGRPSGPLPNDAGYVINEDLGKQLVSGVEATGTRESVTYNPGQFGNDRKMTVSKEFWYSPQLGLNLISKRSDPRFGSQTFTITNLTLAEPDPQLFEPPAGLQIIDRRSPPEPAPAPAN